MHNGRSTLNIDCKPFTRLTVLQGASMAAYPLDTIRRRMMMTSGEKASYISFSVSRLN